MSRFLVYPSEKRIAAKDALLHPYFFSPPLPAHHSELPIPRVGGEGRRGGRGSAGGGPREYNVDAPIEDSLVDPKDIAPYVANLPPGKN